MDPSILDERSSLLRPTVRREKSYFTAKLALSLLGLVAFCGTYFASSVQIDLTPRQYERGLNILRAEYEHGSQRFDHTEMVAMACNGKESCKYTPPCTKENYSVLWVFEWDCGPKSENGSKAFTKLLGACGSAIYVTCPKECPEPSTCTAPGPSTFSYEAPIWHPRYEWPENAGYCGAVSVTIIAQSYGIWLSQDFIRHFTPDDYFASYFGPGNIEINHLNLAKTLEGLNLRYNQWDWWKTNSTEEYLMFIQRNLVKHNPVVWFVILSGDPNFVTRWIHYNHIEPVFGLYTNHSLDEYHGDNVLVHASDWDQFHFYRAFDSLPANLDFQGNCKHAVSQAGHNEAYPCIHEDGPNFGWAIEGIVDPKGRAIRISLDVHDPFEPNVRAGHAPYYFHNPTVRAEEPLEVGASYTLFRYDNDPSLLPLDSNFEDSRYTRRYDFTATSSQWSHDDPEPILSSSGVYFVLVKTQQK